MSTLGVVAEILREVAPRALKAHQIADLAGGRLPTSSKTPETVVSRDLALEVRDKGASSRFIRVDRGEFVLKEALSTALYNDNDTYAAAWSRNLITAGEIAAGVVDERSIRDLKPADVASYRQFHAFSGIGIWSRALRDAGWPDDINVWSGSCPCVPFSSAGRKRGFSDEQHLWPEWFRLISACRPAWIFGEQVSSKDGLAWLDLVRSDLEGADYTLRVLDIPACCVGAPHRRQRLYFAAYARERATESVSAEWLAHARERRCSILGTARLHDQGQPGNDAARCGEVDLGSVGLGDSCLAGGRWDAGAVYCPQAVGEGERIEAGDFSNELVAPGAVDRSAACGSPVTNDEMVRGAVDRSAACGSPVVNGELVRGAVDRSVACGVRSAVINVELVRGAVDLASDGSGWDQGFRPGDRIRLGGDPTWEGSVGGFWADDVEWIYCRPDPDRTNGRWRPVGTGIVPLAARNSSKLGGARTSQIRCFGNAIVLPLARAFIEAVIDTIVDVTAGTVSSEEGKSP